jgi:hypothetical protein
MSQAIFNTIVPSTTSGNQLATLLNNFKDAAVSGFSGTTRPSALQAGGYWIDLTNDALGLWDFKIFDGTQDITIFTINKSTGTASIASADALFKIQKTSADSVAPILRLIKQRLANNGQTLTGDSVGEIQFYGWDNAGVGEEQARISSASTDNVTSGTKGASLIFQITKTGAAAMQEVMRLIDGKVGIGTGAPEQTLHVVGTGVKVEKQSDDAIGAKVIQKKKRVTGVGQVQASDVIGGTDFMGLDDAGAETTVASVEISARENITSTANGSRIKFRNKKVGSTAFTDQIVIDDKTIIDDLQVTKGVVVKSSAGVRTEQASDDAVGTTQTFKKARIAGNGQVTTSDQIAITQYKSQTNAGAEIDVAQIEVVAREVHTATNQGAKIVIRNKKQATNTFVDQIVIDDKVTITDLIVTNLTTTNTVLGNVTEVTDASMKVNKGGNRASADAQTAGIEIEMSDATTYKFGYDSTKASKFVAGEVGALKEVVNVDATQTLTNKTISAASNTVTVSATGVTATTLNAALTEIKGVADTNTTAIGTKVTGPASATDNRVARFDLATGKLIQDSLVTIDDSGNVTGVVDLTSTGTANIANLITSGQVTFTGDTADNTTTGASAVIVASSTIVTRLTNASLVSVSGHTNTTGGRLRILINNTGAPIIVKNDDATVTAANRIYTGTGADITVADKGSFYLLYNSTIGRNLMIGGGGGSASVDVQTFTLNSTDVSNGYVALSREAKKIISVEVKGWAPMWPTDDFSTTLVSGVTRIVFAGDMTTAAVNGSKVKVVYTY